VVINKNDNDDANGTDDSGQPSVSSQRKGRLLAVRENDISNRERAVIGCEADILNRQESVTLREEVADLRDEKTTLHDQETQEAKTKQAASDEHVNILQKANARLIISTIEAHKQAAQAESDKIQMDYLAHHDTLTGLPNRMLLQDRLSQTIEMARRQGSQLAVLFMDLDRFKDINDSFGHAVGDQLLQSVAQRLLSCVRQSDTISRQGGDEFVLMLRNIERAEDARLSAQKMLAALVLPHHIDQHDFNISVSIGISIYPDDGQDAETLIKSADTAMFYAKENGRNNYKFFEQDMNVRAEEAQSIEASLHRALERQEFVLHYQPKINLHSGKIVGVEALIRWQHPKQGLLPSGEFMHIAEDCGLIQSIDRWVLREACSQTRFWLQAGLPPITIAINTSSLEFRAKDFLENIRATLEEAYLEPRFLELELTESVLMHDVKSTDSVLHALADLGVRIAVDDYGTGYSNLSYLKQFPIDTLKIDQSFVNQMTCDSNNASIVSAMISMAKKLKLRVIAEGVETPEQYAVLLAQDCDEGQGYYFGHPVVAKTFAILLRSRS
jgi:diguanylate cyclase (GGDEF)-like protein